MPADLHVHSYYSDGLLSPEEIVLSAKANGVGLISVTDHDCALGFDEVYKSCVRLGIKTVRGIEISAYEGDLKIHMLGYNFDAENPVFRAFSKRLYDGSIARAEDIISKLNKNGVGISVGEVYDCRKTASSPVHVMHIARACAKKGYCGGNAFTFFSKYLAFGRCAYSGINRPSPEEAICAVNACGGFASLAHPGRIETGREELYALISKLCGCGLGGIEAVYPAHTVNETAYYKEIARTFSLAVTGGSDTHIAGGNRKIGSPYFEPDAVLAQKLSI